MFLTVVSGTNRTKASIPLETHRKQSCKSAMSRIRDRCPRCNALILVELFEKLSSPMPSISNMSSLQLRDSNQLNRKAKITETGTSMIKKTMPKTRTMLVQSSDCF
mmetsp:Transcript_32502/g.53506  ORF Transcript_32502/g.53506 Transcript_32502/m.53506 type:complete len:106 (+) Transcript_32502:241-558(+)